jgi:NADH:ubiquinone oxidoreductase subunit
MSIGKNIFTWWEGVSFGTWLTTKLRGARVGEDALGNVYYTGGKRTDGSPRRWVMYSGSNDSSRVSPEWFSWLHGQIDDVPDKALPAPRLWEQAATANLTGTTHAHLPAGAPSAGGKRATASGDYVAWNPDAT